MSTDSEVKKNKPASSFIAQLLGLGSFEFETPLSIEECVRRLQKLPGKMTYLQAKGRAELANTSVDIQANLINSRVEIRDVFRKELDPSGYLLGTIEYSEIYETTLVRGVPVDDYNPMTFALIACSFVVVAVALVIFYGEYWSCALLIVLMALIALAIAILSPGRRRRNIINLLQNVLTEPDESKL